TDGARCTTNDELARLLEARTNIDDGEAYALADARVQRERDAARASAQAAAAAARGQKTIDEVVDFVQPVTTVPGPEPLPIKDVQDAAREQAASAEGCLKKLGVPVIAGLLGTLALLI